MGHCLRTSVRKEEDNFRAVQRRMRFEVALGTEAVDNLVED